MEEYLKIDVTPNLQKCLEDLKSAVESMPDGDLKTRAEGALDYLESTFQGEPQPEAGMRCLPNKPIVI
ncbi:MAG: hypothetical protein GTO17_06575 [Candidatus Aminicenantes bacterium]|nr:hypothetical protein [Candidatus Aminicenantes bacterium]